MSALNTGEQIKSLLALSGQNLLPPNCFASFDDAVEEHRTTRAIPLKELRDIYRVRARINESNGSPISGFNELLHQLEAMSDEPICVSSLSTNAGQYIVFTDAKIEKLIGVLFKPTSRQHTNSHSNGLDHA